MWIFSRLFIRRTRMIDSMRRFSNIDDYFSSSFELDFGIYVERVGRIPRVDLFPRS